MIRGTIGNMEHINIEHITLNKKYLCFCNDKEK